MAGQLFFYATREDIIELVEIIDQENTLKYSLAGLHEESKMFTCDSLKEYEGIGIVDSLSKILCPRFLVSFTEEVITIREIPQSKGGIKYAVDQLRNPDTIIFIPAGENEKEKIIVEGSISTSSKSETSKRIFKIFEKK